MQNFVMYCKSYRKDFNHFKNLYKSFQKYNKDNITLYVSVPQEDLKLFDVYKCQNVIIIEDEAFASKYYAKETSYNFSLGYFNQEVCKLAFWETGYALNYLCLDSDAVFIRDFYIKDFMKNDEIPYTVLVQDKEIHSASWYPHYKQRKFWIKKIWEYMEYDDCRYRTCHGMQVINSKVMQSLRQDFMLPRNLEYKDLIEISPLEFSWYNCWFQKSEIIKEYAIEHTFRYFHNRADFLFSILEGLSIERLKNEYVGITLNSNWNKRGRYPRITNFYQFMCKILSKL